ncbi:putative 4-hydroxyphenylacetate isomerase/decarboxylase [Actinacidiphila reveromycinica]|uniref:Putative 4-hydroxyphenylacetate isomerase/decarboxylase n=1 Tax=Actinacidiphila reveromycinica TaxID=659352 RepID=A0A7U3UPE4_9ACTN|nr:fumarylacetoacetate hydrolase family protein [Streptomyces sp. SN-593]BBA96344.1 putative 4-hydroxyphenylacetate isomerase/decarboxylase [Streptomyces sp. SN-593]
MIGLGRAEDPQTWRPGKIIAVHAGYASRAAERGERPEHPSYFLKPASSVAPSGGEVERPAGTEQLTCEGEIALVIGSPARRVRREEAWLHVSWVSAANDLGVGELRDHDHGSLLRAKGRDGFTPLGPELIDAGSVDPAGLRVRTWVNGEVVQDATTADLLFPLEQIVADLSQHLTLEPGDVILTGTPAGSRVLAPGDVVEVEVDAPQAAAAPSSGRLRTTVVQGDVPLDADLGAVPAPPAGLTPELRDKLMRAPVAGLSAQLRKRGLDNVCIQGPQPLVAGDKAVGTARTLRFLPNREDLFAAHAGGYNAQKRTFDAVAPGEILVIEARGEQGAATLGDVLALRAHVRGAAGIVTDGAVRDADAVAEVGLPVFAAGRHPAVLGRRHLPWDHDLAIACGGATVRPGDVVVADSDGAVVIPPALVEEVVDAALAQEDEDAWIAEQVRAGHPVGGLFPMNAAWRARYERREEGGR